MKLTKSLLVVTLACGTIWAQAPADQSKTPAKTPPAAAKKNTAPAKAPATATKPAATAIPVKGTAQAPAPAKGPATPAKAPATAAKPVTPAAPASKGMTPATTAAKPAPKSAPTAKPATAPATAKTAAPVKPAVVPQKAPVAKAPVAKAPVAKAPVAKAPVAKVPAKTMPTTAAKPKEGQAKPASAKEQTTATRVGKQRDPFVSPVVRSQGTISSGCDTGKRCLVVDQIVLKGIVKSPSGFIAVVENPAKRAYFMRENDPVFNGKISRITGDTVVFQEQVMDKLGKQTMREVVKKVNAPIV